MNIAEFDFHLPTELIAQNPVEVRDQSRLLVVDRQTRSISHHTFQEIGRFLPAGATLIRNNASVLPARLHGTRPTGGSVECLLLQPTANPAEWWCLVKPGKKLPVGAHFSLPEAFSAKIAAVAEDGRRLVHFETTPVESFLQMVNRVGEMPLPPYIHRQPDDRRREQDRERYQTVYADRAKQVAAAAPTAGLHFTPELIENLRASGFRFSDITLHVGLGTFQPIKTDTVEDHQIHREIYEIPTATADFLRNPGTSARVAIGTTAVRAIEDILQKTTPAAPLNSTKAETAVAEADIFIYPPRQFRGVDALVTNFHLPRSSLLCLVSAFLTPGETDGIAWLRDIYAEAIRHRYRFFSYGDAMLIL